MYSNKTTLNSQDLRLQQLATSYSWPPAAQIAHTKACTLRRGTILVGAIIG